MPTPLKFILVLAVVLFGGAFTASLMQEAAERGHSQECNDRGGVWTNRGCYRWDARIKLPD